MNKSERQTVLEKTLYDSFNPLFLDFIEKLKKESKKQIPKRFLELLQDEESKKYVSSYSIGQVSLKNEAGEFYTVAMPRYNNNGEKPPKQVYRSDSEFKALVISDLKVPYELTHIKIINTKFFHEYMGIWDKYTEAHATMRILLFSYKTRAKFQTDFPELAKYLPPKMEPTKLPAVQVDKVKFDLAKFGIPAA